MFMGPLMAFALAVAAFMSSPAVHADNDPPVLAASTATAEQVQDAKSVTGYATADLVIAGVVVVATVGFIVWRNKVWNKGGPSSGSPGRPSKDPLEPYPRE
jgi:hypothetical protein